MTTKESQSRDRRIVERIMAVLRVHRRLRQYAEMLSVTFENAAVILRGELPSPDLKDELIPAIRQAGVLCQVFNRVQVSA